MCFCGLVMVCGVMLFGVCVDVCVCLSVVCVWCEGVWDVRVRVCV